MKNKKSFVLYCGLIFVYFSTALFGVTDQEIEQIRSAMPDKPVVTPRQTRTMLVFSLCNGHTHSSIPYWKQALDIMSEKTGAFKVVHSDDMGIFTSEALAQFDVICLNNTTKLVPDKAQQKAILDFIKSGKGIVGIHAANDNFYEWDEGAMMMGGIFKGHPWTGDGTWAIKLDEPDHPLMKSFEGRNFKINDEIYRTLPPHYSRQNQRVLMSLDISDPNTKNAPDTTPEDMDTGISWIKPVGKGRLFYCSLGHNHHLLWNKAVLEHYLAGIQYAAGDLQIDDQPLPAATAGPDLSDLDKRIKEVSRQDWDSDNSERFKLAAMIGSCHGNPDTRGKIERKLAAALQSDTTLAAKDFICRQLAIIGTEQSVAALSAMLSDVQTYNMARYALEKIPGTSVNDALVDAARKTKDQEIRIGLITTLGIRRHESVILLSQELLTEKTEKEPAVAQALTQSLGSLGTAQAAAELTRILPQLTGTAKDQWPDAMLMCSNAMHKAGHKKEATELYQKLYQSDAPVVARAAALQAWAGLDAAQVEPVLAQLISGKEPVLQTAAIQSLVFMGNQTSFLKTVASAATDLSPEAQIQLVTAMPTASQEIGRSLAATLLDSGQESVQIAACHALELTGDPSVIETLARRAAIDPSRPVRQAAQEAIIRIPGKEVNAAILQKIAAQDDEAVTVELIKAAAGRQIKEAPEILLTTAKSEKKKISGESIQALQALAGPDDMEKLVELLIARPDTPIENALTVVAQTIPDRDQRAKILLDKYPAVTGQQKIQISMLTVMGKLGDTHTIDLLKKEFQSSDPAIRQAAFRAMTDWPGTELIDTLKSLSAQKDIDPKNQILAFRAYIRMLSSSVTDANRKSRIDAFIAAYPTAPRLEEKKIVIAAMGQFNDVRTLSFLQTVTTVPDLKAEAQAGMIQICEKLLSQNPSAVKPVLETLKTEGSSETIKKKAAQLLESVH